MEEGFDFNKQYKEQSNELKAVIRKNVLDDATSLIHKAVIVFAQNSESEDVNIQAISNCKNDTVTILSMIENGLVKDETLKRVVDIIMEDVNASMDAEEFIEEAKIEAKDE